MNADINCSFLWLIGYLFLHFIFLCVKYEIILSDNVMNTCSMSCAEADWESSHSLLCTGETCDPRHRDALLKFVKHANGKSPSLRTSIIFNTLKNNCGHFVLCLAYLLSLFFWQKQMIYSSLLQK
jgi:hypothetical protein